MQLQNQFRDPPSLEAPDASETILAGIRELSGEITARSAEIEAGSSAIYETSPFSGACAIFASQASTPSHSRDSMSAPASCC